MSLEEQFNPNYQEHPEVASNPEAMLPATEATKQALLDIVTAKSAGGRIIGASVNRTLFAEGSSRGTLLVAKFDEGADATDSRRLGQVYFPRGLDGDSDNPTNYFLVRIPDGLHIEKSTPAKPVSLEDAGVNADSDPSEILSAGMRIGRQHAEAARIERDLGLDFVSEEEARMVLGLVEEVQAR